MKKETANKKGGPLFKITSTTFTCLESKICTWNSKTTQRMRRQQQNSSKNSGQQQFSISFQPRKVKYQPRKTVSIQTNEQKDLNLT